MSSEYFVWALNKWLLWSFGYYIGTITVVVSIRLLNFPSCPLRRDWYQTESQVTVTLMVKNVKKEEVHITFKEKEVTTKFFLSFALTRGIQSSDNLWSTITSLLLIVMLSSIIIFSRFFPLIMKFRCFQSARFNLIIFTKAQMFSLLFWITESWTGISHVFTVANMPPYTAINNCSCPFTKRSD